MYMDLPTMILPALMTSTLLVLVMPSSRLPAAPDHQKVPSPGYSYGGRQRNAVIDKAKTLGQFLDILIVTSVSKTVSKRSFLTSSHGEIEFRALAKTRAVDREKNTKTLAKVKQFRLS